MDSSLHKQRTWISQISNTLEMNLEWKKNPPPPQILILSSKVEPVKNGN